MRMCRVITFAVLVFAVDECQLWHQNGDCANDFGWRQCEKSMLSDGINRYFACTQICLNSSMSEASRPHVFNPPAFFLFMSLP